MSKIIRYQNEKGELNVEKVIAAEYKEHYIIYTLAEDNETLILPIDKVRWIKERDIKEV